MALSFISGSVLWTIVEYSLHRWVFHLDAENGGAVKCTFHFLIHGLHHKVIVKHLDGSKKNAPKHFANVEIAKLRIPKICDKWL